MIKFQESQTHNDHLIDILSVVDASVSAAPTFLPGGIYHSPLKGEGEPSICVCCVSVCTKI